MKRRYRRHAGPRYLGRDKLHNEICHRLGLFPGITVWDTHDVGGGFPDIVVGFRGKTYLFELKGDPPKLTASEKQWHSIWKGHARIYASNDASVIVDGILTEIGYPGERPVLRAVPPMFPRPD